MCPDHVSIDRCRKIAEGWDPAPKMRRRTLGILESWDKHEFRWRFAVLLREQNVRSSTREMEWFLLKSNIGYLIIFEYPWASVGKHQMKLMFWRSGCQDFVCSRFLRNFLSVIGPDSSSFWATSTVWEWFGDSAILGTSRRKRAHLFSRKRIRNGEA